MEDKDKILEDNSEIEVKAKKAKNSNKKSHGDIFIIEKDGFAYYKDKRLNLVCKKAKLIKDSPYEGYMWQYDYMSNLDWFKRYVMLMKVNRGHIRYIGMTEDEFFSLGGDELDVVDVDAIDIRKIKH